MSIRQAQYRPSLSEAEINQLLEYIPRQSPLYKKLAVYQVKINVGLNVPAYIKTGEQEKNSIAARLGLIGTATTPAEHAEQQRQEAQKIEHKALFAPQLMSSADKYTYLGNKALAGTITEEEKAEGRALELELYQMDMGTFV